MRVRVVFFDKTDATVAAVNARPTLIGRLLGDVETDTVVVFSHGAWSDDCTGRVIGDERITDALDRARRAALAGAA